MRSIAREHVVRQAPFIREDLAGLEGDAPEDGVAHGRRLLEDLLEHEVLVARLLGGNRIPRDSRRRLRNRRAGEVRELRALACHHGHFLIAQEHDVAGIGEDRWNIRRHEVFVVAQTDHDRWAVADRDDLVRVVSREQDQCEQPFSRLIARRTAPSSPSCCHSRSTRCATTSVSVSVTNTCPWRLQLALQLEVVLDDAVVNDHDSALAVAMRVRVLLGRPPVGGPPCMPKAVIARRAGRPRSTSRGCQACQRFVG